LTLRFDAVISLALATIARRQPPMEPAGTLVTIGSGDCEMGMETLIFDGFPQS
jgi:hypothetical protein